MKKTLFALALLTLMVGCTDSEGVRRHLHGMGYTDVEIHGYSFFGCAQEDTWKTKFSAKSPQGQLVTGVVCAGLLKGSTVRFY